MVAILTIPSELESARRLQLPTYTSAPVVRARRDGELTWIRWGNSDPGLLGCRVHNSRRAVRENCHKAHALQRLQTVVATPLVYLAGESVPQGVRVVLRTIEHSGGAGFRVRSGPRAVPPGHYATRWLETSLEHRVWFAWGRTLVARRVPLKGQRAGRYPCRSEWGYRFLRRPAARLDTLIEQTVKAAAALSLTLGAADVLWVHGQHVFLELNSAPSVDARPIREFFQAAIQAELG